MVIGLCERFHCLPSELAREDIELMRMVAIVGEMRREQGGEDDG